MLVWLSPHTIVMPGWVSPVSGADDMHDPLAELTEAVQRDPEVLAVLRSASTWARLVGSRSSRVSVGTLWSSVARVSSGSSYPPVGRPQPVERLRLEPLVDEVQVDVQRLRLVRPDRDGVPLPDLVDHAARPDHPGGVCSPGGALDEVLRLDPGPEVVGRRPEDL